MTDETMNVLCNRCGYNRFIVIKPNVPLPPEHIYFTCTQCLRENNKRLLHMAIPTDNPEKVNRLL